MAFSGNNQSIYNAAFAGAFGGMCAGATDATAADYATFGAVATAFATKVDATVPTNASLSTGAGGTTVAPVAGVTTATLNALTHLVALLSFNYFKSQLGNNLTAVANDYAVPAAAINAQLTAAATQYAAAPGGSSLT